MRFFTYTFGAVVILAALSALFVGERNLHYAKHELGVVTSAADALCGGLAPTTPIIAAGLVEKPTPSARYPFLRHRQITSVSGSSRRALGGPNAPADDKLLADAATEVERTGRPFARFLDDGRIIAACVELPPFVSDGKATGVTLANPTRAPAPYPFILLAVALAGAALAATRAGAWALFVFTPVAVVTVGPAGGILAAALAASFVAVRRPLDRVAASLREHRVPYLYFFPAAVGMAILVIVPFLCGCVLGFFDHARGEWQFVGLSNFADILSGGGRALDDPLNFYFTLAVTLLWTAVNVALHVGLGVTLALALHQKWLRGRAVFRTLLILPWAIPSYITALIWRGMFGKQYGAVNGLLGLFGIPPSSWFSHFAGAFTANVVTNAWLGFPFMMIVALGALDSIPRELYEAAAVDGAGAWARFRHITLPGLRPALLPAVILGSVWTFNMFNVIYLVSGGRPAGTTDILVTQAYRWAFERGQRYGMAAAYAMVIFLLLVGWMALMRRVGRSNAQSEAR